MDDSSQPSASRKYLTDNEITEVASKLRIADPDKDWRVQHRESDGGPHVAKTSSKLDVTAFLAWPNWEKAKPELKSNAICTMKMDGFKDAKRLDSYVFRHFTTSAFTQMENVSGVAQSAPVDITGAWMGTKATMSKASLDITREGGNDTPFVTYYTDNDHLLIMEILDVKQCAWP
ncbi:hypothetical protein IW261DRAFT_1416282 [Armillaria novae-zelandiae]|uniref:Uncharacterized protein n=1 Tax=Armillaria novae-zelandiae TaxID=153914 RepID=A0AA39PNP8_9AGAR|nr:hypothetical protein IW261DRAFT_1416282 [Armillaria novae-zelandiae]